MFCPKCGNQLSDVARFCPKCGKKIELPNAAPVPEGRAENLPPHADRPQPKPEAAPAKAPKKRSGKKGLVIAICVILAAALLAGAFFFIRPKLMDRKTADDVEMRQVEELEDESDEDEPDEDTSEEPDNQEPEELANGQEETEPVELEAPPETQNADASAAVPTQAPVELTAEEALQRARLLLFGMTAEDITENVGPVASWPEEAIQNVLYRKLWWDYRDDYESTMQATLGISKPSYDNERCCYSYDLDEIDALTRSIFGCDFPRTEGVWGIRAENESVVLEPADGEPRSVMQVQSCKKDGTVWIADGVITKDGVERVQFEGYFRAVLHENADSCFDLTISGLELTQQDQRYDGLVAFASSYLKERTLTHLPANALDGNLQTAWVENAAGAGVGEWIELDTSDDSQMTVCGVEFFRGYQVSGEFIAVNGYPTKLLLEGENFRQTITLHHSVLEPGHSDWIALDEPLKSNWIRITIMDATVGTKFEDTCISEIVLHGNNEAF